MQSIKTKMYLGFKAMSQKSSEWRRFWLSHPLNLQEQSSKYELLIKNSKFWQIRFQLQKAVAPLLLFRPTSVFKQFIEWDESIMLLEYGQFLNYLPA